MKISYSIETYMTTHTHAIRFLASVSACLCATHTAVAQEGIVITEYPKAGQKIELEDGSSIPLEAISGNRVYNPYKAEFLFGQSLYANGMSIGKAGQDRYPGTVIGWHPRSALPYTITDDTLYMGGKVVLTAPPRMKFYHETLNNRYSAQHFASESWVEGPEIGKSSLKAVRISDRGEVVHAFASENTGPQSRIAQWTGGKWTQFPVPRIAGGTDSSGGTVWSDRSLQNVVIKSYNKSVSEKSSPTSRTVTYFHFQGGKLRSAFKPPDGYSRAAPNAFLTDGPIWACQNPKSNKCALLYGNRRIDGNGIDSFVNGWPIIGSGGISKTFLPSGEILSGISSLSSFPKGSDLPENSATFLDRSSMTLILASEARSDRLEFGELVKQTGLTPEAFSKQSILCGATNAAGEDVLAVFLKNGGNAPAIFHTFKDGVDEKRSIAPLVISRPLSHSPRGRYLVVEGYIRTSNALGSNKSQGGTCIIDVLSWRMFPMKIDVASIAWDGDNMAFLRTGDNKLVVVELEKIPWVNFR